jgi:membrane peptidoglycan carboxypeptidase
VLTQTLKKTANSVPLAINSLVNGSFCLTIEGTNICNDPGDSKVSGPAVTIANAMKYSLNTSFDLLASRAGPDAVAATAHAAGIAKTDANGGPTLVDSNGHTSFGIGIGDYPVTPLDQAVGFGTFADNGKQHNAYFVQKVTDSTGSVVYQHRVGGTQALDPKVANDVTLTMEPIAAYSHDPLSGGRVSAAKTGTEGIQNDPMGNNSDAWMVGYTPQVSAAVWVGSGDSVTPIYNAAGNPEYGSDLPGKTWALFMDSYLAKAPNLPMASKQLITGGTNPAPTATPSPSPTPTPTPTKGSTSSGPSPTPSPTGAASTSVASSSSAVVTPTPPVITPSPVCTTGLLGVVTCSSPPAAPGG